MPKNRFLLQCGTYPVVAILFFLTASLPAAIAQTPSQTAREAQWAAYQPPAGKFIRFVDKETGLSFRIPADWQQQKNTIAGTLFTNAVDGANVQTFTDNIPDGIGVAAYVSSFLQSVRNEPIKADSMVVRRVRSSGLEWREITYEIFQPGGTSIFQTLWITAAGPKAYGLALSSQSEHLEKIAPVFKRIVSSVRIGATGHWDAEYESLRAHFTNGPNSDFTEENEAALVAEALRSGRESIASTTGRLARLFAASPETTIDLITDPDPQVRTAAIAALGKSGHPKIVDLMVWALTDKDVFASTMAAQILAANWANEANEANGAGQSNYVLTAIKGRLRVLAENPATIVRAGAALGEQASRTLIDELLRGDNPKEQMAGLHLALITEKFDMELPLARLLASADPGIPHAIEAVLERHPSSGTVRQLLKYLRTDNEQRAVRILGDIAPVEVVEEFHKRIAEIDAKLDLSSRAAIKNSRAKTKTKSSGKRTGRKVITVSGTPVPVPPAAALPPLIAKWENNPEVMQLALLRGELDMASRKIVFRDRWDKAKTEDDRRWIKSQIEKENIDLIGWSAISLKARAPEASAAVTFDAAKLPKLKDAPTTGETIFPKAAFSYLMAPDFAATIERLDSALSGVQMATVRDQMNFAFILKALKASLASEVGADFTGDASRAIGIDLKSPIAMASWLAPDEQGKSVTRSALTVRVTDQVRFERLLANYQRWFGDFDEFFQASAGLARFAGVIPGAVPMLFAYSASGQARGVLSSRRAAPPESRIASLKPFAHVRRDNLLPITTIIRPVISESYGVRNETICIAYFGDTAVVSSSRAAIADLIAAGVTGETIAQGEAFTKARSEKGEMVFFSKLDSLLDSFFNLAEAAEENKEIGDIVKAFGIESGALQLSPNTWETVFKIGLAGNELTKSFSPFKVEQLAAPRELLPRSTILYAGTIIDPPKLYGTLKGLESGEDKGIAGKGGFFDKEIEADIEKLIVPNMQGEIAGALVSFDPFFTSGKRPALVLAVKLKDEGLASAFQAGKLFANLKRQPNATVLGSPVVSLGEAGETMFVAVTRDYLVLADSIETLQLLETKEKLSSSRDYARSTKDTPDNLAIFATYNLESASHEAGKVLSGKMLQDEMVFSSAITNAFHSQRAYLAVDKDGLTGRLSVAFGREGSYSVGDLAKSAGEIDIANAMIEPKGLSVHDSTRVESMTLRVTGRTPGIGPRLRDDLAKFDFQRVESSSDSSVMVTTSARRIPEKLTISLPVTGDEFAIFLKSSSQINSFDPRVVALAQEIAGADKDGRSVARKIAAWTYGNLKWKKVQSDAIETLASREADCLEHSELYVALARALGLPARVVSGAALSDGSFGAHAWVEIYLGKWVELDPTWGLMDHVDATHMRFDGDAFISYAMLNQLELEIASVRRTVADYQRDPIRLAREFSRDPEKSELAFDLSLAAEQALGRSRWAGLDDKQRGRVISAFEKTVKEICENWKIYASELPRVLLSDIKADRASVTLLRGEELLRLTLAPRDGAWFITEHELLDDALAEFADALIGELEPAGRRAAVYGQTVDASIKHLEKIIAREGEKPELLLSKARLLKMKEWTDEFEAYKTAQKAKKESEIGKVEEGKVDTGKVDVGKVDAGKIEAVKPAPDKDKGASISANDLFKDIVNRWPEFAPGRKALARELFPSIYNKDAANPPEKDAELLFTELQAYARLAPYDPRPWRDMAVAYEQFKKLEDAASAFEKAIELDHEYISFHRDLVDFHLRHNHTERAKYAFARMLKSVKDADAVFEYFRDGEDGYEPEYAASLESLLHAFTKEMEGSSVGWSLLAELQYAQEKAGDAIKSTQRALSIKPSAESFVFLSMLYRSERRYAESLSAADQAVKLEAESVAAHFERACSLARLGRKDEAMKALNRMFKIDPDSYFNTEEADLQSLSAIPDFRAMKEKIDKPGKTPK